MSFSYMFNFDLDKQSNIRLPSDIDWSEEQLEALERLKNFITSEEKVITLVGNAGSGN